MIIIWQLKCRNDIQDNSTYSTWFGSWTYIIYIIKVINRYIKKHFCPIFEDFSKFHSTYSSIYSTLNSWWLWAKIEGKNSEKIH